MRLLIAAALLGTAALASAHMSPEQVGDLASKAGVSVVLLNHIVPGLDDERDMSIYSTGVLKRFKGPVIVGQDLFEYDLAKAQTDGQPGKPGSGGTAASSSVESASSMHVARVILLGTGGGPRLRTKRSQITTLLIVDGRPYLIDAGFGVVPRLTAAGLDARFVDRVFITHNHSDHSGGLGELYNFIWTDRGQKKYQPGPVEVIGPKGTKEVSDGALSMLRVSSRIFGSQNQIAPMSSMINAREINGNGVVYSDDLVKVTAVENSHYDIIIPAGSEAKRSGDKSYSFRFDTPAGNIVFTGDTNPSDALVELARNADLLVSEVAISPASRPRPDFSAEGSAQSFRSSDGGQAN